MADKLWKMQDLEEQQALEQQDPLNTSFVVEEDPDMTPEQPMDEETALQYCLCPSLSGAFEQYCLKPDLI